MHCNLNKWPISHQAIDVATQQMFDAPQNIAAAPRLRGLTVGVALPTTKPKSATRLALRGVARSRADGAHPEEKVRAHRARAHSSVVRARAINESTERWRARGRWSGRARRSRLRESRPRARLSTAPSGRMHPCAWTISRRLSTFLSYFGALAPWGTHLRVAVEAGEWARRSFRSRRHQNYVFIDRAFRFRS